MCITIFSGEQPSTIVETRLNIEAETVGHPEDEDFFENNSGPGKRFPGVPTCNFCVVDIPCLCQLNSKGSSTPEILKDILSTIDHYKVYDRTNSRKPFSLVDKHISRLKLPFLRYIVDIEHEWAVCIGVPYGMAMWQVGESDEQNGSFNIASVVTKNKMQKKTSTCMIA